MPAGKKSPTKGREGVAKQARKGSKVSKGAMKGKQKPARKVLAPRGQSQSCHQCRQSIHSSKGVSEVKSGKERLKCSTCTRFWCEQCLHNRYGVVREKVELSSWSCPVCNDNCNCSLCRKKEGKLATGILTPLVRTAGYGSVSDFLDKGTDDIAKCLQWKSPKVAVEKTSESNKPQEDSPSQTTSSKPTRKRPEKRKRIGSDQENVGTTANQESSKRKRKSESHNDSSCHDNSKVGCQGNTSSCHGDNRPKRRRLSHSHYSITLEGEEEEEVCGEAEQATKVKRTVSDNRRTPEKKAHCGESTTADQQIEDESVDEFALFESFLRRSPRKRKTTEKYVAENFHESPKSSRTKRRRSKMDEGIQDETAIESDRDLEQKKEELESLRMKRMGAFCSQRVVEKQREVEKRVSLRAEARRTRERLREEQRLHRQAVREKLHLAKSIVKEAQRDKIRKVREKERVRKQRELEKLKQKKVSQKKKMHELVTTPFLKQNEDVRVLQGDSPEGCKIAGIPELPELPTLQLGVPWQLSSRFLFVSEFLFTFANALELKRKLSAVDLCTLLSSGRGLSDVYLHLLRAVVEPGGKWRKGVGRKQRDLELLARDYLHSEGKNGFITGGSENGEGLSLEESVAVLEHLCLEALQSSPITEAMESVREGVDCLRKEQRIREREKTKEISEELKTLCDSGASLGQLEDKRSEVARQLAEMRHTSECEQYEYGLMMRGSVLGEDRYGRQYWRLQSVPGIVVEIPSPDMNDKSNAEGGSWLVVDNEERLKQLINCLYPVGVREHFLRQSLEFHYVGVVSSLDSAKQAVPIKRFYGRS